MSLQNRVFTLAILIIVYELPLCITQDSLTFSPSTPLCIGEEVQMTCFVVPPTAQPFIDIAALLSFNGSAALSPALVTSTGIIDGISISRYTASSDGLTTSNDRPGVRLSISDYQATDRYVVFGCHGLYSGIVASPVIISSRTQRLAVAPLVPVLVIPQTDPNCSNTLISWSTPSSDRSITSYSVYRDGVSIYNGPNTINQFTDNTQLSINTVYEYSVVAISCAGNSTAGVNSISIGGYTLTSALLKIIPSEVEAGYSWTLTADENTPPILIEYLLQFNYTSDDDETILFSQTFSQTSESSRLDLFDFLPLYNLSTGVITQSTPVCIQITEQCGQELPGDILCDDQTSNILVVLALTIAAIIGISVGVCICCCVCILILVVAVILTIVCCVSKNKADHKKYNTDEIPEYVDMNRTAVRQRTESQHYTHMSSLDKKQLPPTYENMHTY